MNREEANKGPVLVGIDWAYRPPWWKRLLARVFGKRIVGIDRCGEHSCMVLMVERDGVRYAIDVKPGDDCEF